MLQPGNCYVGRIGIVEAKSVIRVSRPSSLLRRVNATKPLWVSYVAYMCYP